MIPAAIRAPQNRLLRALTQATSWCRGHRRTLIEVGALSATFIAIYTTLIHYQAFEAFYEYTRQYEAIQLDHIGMSIIPTCIVLVIVVLLRARDANRAQAKLLEALTQLEDLYQRQDALRREANDANLAKSTFLANMSHELRTPLNAIIGYTEMVAEDMEADKQHGRAVADLGRVIGSAKHLLSLINEVLDLAKIEAGRTQFEISELDLAELISEVLEVCQPLAEKTGSRLSCNVDSDIGTVRSDALRLKQCLLNLVSNACKFTDRGFVTIRLERLQTEGRERIQFAVEDTGVGMTAEQMVTLFQPFQQADSSISKRFGGTGLGLSITREIARQLGGDVWFESAPGIGTIAFLTFDAGGMIAQANDAGVDALIGDEQAPLVLVIEDMADARDLAARALVSAGFSVQGVATARAGLDTARKKFPTLIVIDVFLPDASGWSVLDQLKHDPATRDIPVVVLSISDDRARSVSLGAAEHLVKPVRHDVLAAAALRLSRAPINPEVQNGAVQRSLTGTRL